MAVGGYKSANVMNLRKGYGKPSILIAQILDHKIGHYVRPNKVALKYLDLKKDANPDAHLECSILQ
jgi:hypothetical protein